MPITVVSVHLVRSFKKQRKDKLQGEPIAIFHFNICFVPKVWGNTLALLNHYALSLMYEMKRPFLTGCRHHWAITAVLQYLSGAAQRDSWGNDTSDTEVRSAQPMNISLLHKHVYKYLLICSSDASSTQTDSSSLWQADRPPQSFKNMLKL